MRFMCSVGVHKWMDPPPPDYSSDDYLQPGFWSFQITGQVCKFCTAVRVYHGPMYGWEVSEGKRYTQMNRSTVKKLIWITGRGVVLVMRAIQEKQDSKRNLEYWYKFVVARVSSSQIQKQESI